jgi:hypothetical protein
MGMFDTCRGPNLRGQLIDIQVKTWERSMHLYEIGDTVPDIQGVKSYAILDPASEWYIIVINLTLIKFQLEPPALPTFNKWGEKVW